MRDYAEWKNLFPSAANFEMDTRTSVGATPRGRPETCESVTLDPTSAHGQLCSLRGFAAKIHFMAGTSSFPQNALRWRFAGALCGFRRGGVLLRPV